MTEVQKSSHYRPVTPPQAKSPSSHFLTTHAQSIPIQNANGRAVLQNGPLSPVIQNGSYAFDRVIKSGQVHRRLKKKGAWRSSWKPVYLVLRPNLLSVYKDHDETELRASITLSDVTAVAPVKKSNHDHVFGVFSPSKNYHFAGFSAKEAADWITIIRLEARTESVEDLHPPSTSFRQGEPQAGYETTDLSADDDLDAPGSPEVPHWSIKDNKNRAAQQNKVDSRVTSGMTGYSANESFAASQSDFSDAGFSTSGPGSRGYLSSSIPNQPQTLSPIPDDTIPTNRPSYNRGFSNLSDHNIALGATSQTATPKAMPRSIPSSNATPHIPVSSTPADPSRVIRQGYLKLLRTISGVKQWRTIWVVLRAQSLCFYKSSSDAATGTTGISSPTITMPITCIIEAAEIDRKKKQNCFQIISDEKTFKLQTETEEELESWLGGLKSVLVRQEAERERGRGSRNASISQQGQPVGFAVPESSLAGKAGPSSTGMMQQSPPGTREGEQLLHPEGQVGGITMAMRGVSLEQQQQQQGIGNVNGGTGSGISSAGPRRVVSPELQRA